MTDSTLETHPSIILFQWLSWEEPVYRSRRIFRYHVGRSVHHHSGDPILFTVVLHLSLRDAPFFSGFFCGHITVQGINLLLHRKRTIIYNILPCVRRNINARSRNAKFALAKFRKTNTFFSCLERFPKIWQARRRRPPVALDLIALFI